MTRTTWIYTMNDWSARKCSILSTHEDLFFTSCTLEERTTWPERIARLLVRILFRFDPTRHHLIARWIRSRFLVDLRLDIFGKREKGFFNILETETTDQLGRSSRENNEQYFLSHWSPWIWFRIHWKARREDHHRSFSELGDLLVHPSLGWLDVYRACHICFQSAFVRLRLRRAEERHSSLSEERRSNIYFFDVSNPVLDVIETLFTCDVVHQHDSLEWPREMSRRSTIGDRYHRSSIISSGDCFETFLSSSIPEIRSNEIVPESIDPCSTRSEV